MAHLQVPYPRPTRLSDPYQEYVPEGLASLLAKPDSELDWRDYQCLFGPYLPAGTYEESIYFLPSAFEHLLSHEEDALDLSTPVIGFVSRCADRLEADGLVTDVRSCITHCLEYWTREFRVVHFDQEVCKAKEWGLDHNDSVERSEVVFEFIEDLIQFEKHADLGVSFLGRLINNEGDAIKAAWYLELASLEAKYEFDSTLKPFLLVRESLARSAAIVREELVAREPSPTYWKDVFARLSL